MWVKMGGHIGRNLCKESRYLDHLGMVRAMHPGYLPGIGSDLIVIFLEIHMVRVDDVVGEKRERPGAVLFTSAARLVLYRFQLMNQLIHIQPVP